MKTYRTRNNVFVSGIAVALTAALFVSAPALASVTNLIFAGGCPSVEDDAFCFDAGNATEENVALVLGVDQSLVTQVSGGFTVNGIDDTSGTWSISDSSITHLAFKADGYYILGAVTGNSGDWSTDITLWTPDFSTLTCPVGICNPDARPYELADFLNEGGNVAELSNVRAFSVVPIPAAIWLMVGGPAGLLGFRRK